MKAIPQIQQQPRAASDSAAHYAYCAFKEIFVGDRKLQPEGSPYKQYFPAREVIPFTNLSVGVCITDALVNGEPIGTLNAGHNVPNLGGKKDPTVVMQPKSARECAEELLTSYEDWGYKVLTPLTGFSEADVFAVMQTIQPLPYKLRDLAEALETAAERINAMESYVVDDGEELSIELDPLSPDLKKAAFEVLPIIETAVSLAQDKAKEIVADTTQKLEQFYSGQGGKKKADPLDQYVFAEMVERIPSRMTTEPKNNDAIDRLATVLGNNQNWAAKENELEAKRTELDELLAEARELIKNTKKTNKE